MQYALFYLNIIKHTIYEGQQNPELFNLINSTLLQLNTSQNSSKTTETFFYNYICLEGLNPDSTKTISIEKAHKIITNYLNCHIAFPLQLDELTQTPVK